MPILNYTTKISADKTASEIQRILVKAKASAILCEYEDALLVAMSFRIRTKHGMVSFRLPVNIEAFIEPFILIEISKRGLEQKSRPRESLGVFSRIG